MHVLACDRDEVIYVRCHSVLCLLSPASGGASVACPCCCSSRSACICPISCPALIVLLTALSTIKRIRGSGSSPDASHSCSIAWTCARSVPALLFVSIAAALDAGSRLSTSSGGCTFVYSACSRSAVSEEVEGSAIAGSVSPVRVARNCAISGWSSCRDCAAVWPSLFRRLALPPSSRTSLHISRLSQVKRGVL